MSVLPLERREILKNNIPTIFAFKLENLSRDERKKLLDRELSNCMYTYSDGSHCSVGACLTEDEQKNIMKSKVANTGSVHVILRSGDVDIDLGHEELLDRFQSIHDSCCSPNAGPRQFWNLRNALNQILETGELVMCESMRHWGCVHNDGFQLIDGEWVEV